MRKMIRLLMLLAAVIASVIAWGALPESVPVHWNIRGEPDRYGSSEVVLLIMPLVMVAVWALLRFLPRIDPLRDNYAKFAGTYEVLIDTILGLLLVIHVSILLGAGGATDNVVLIARLAIGVMLLVMGNVMPRTRQNWFVGVRTPWTLASPRVWEKTHRVAGYGFVAIGILVIATTPLAPQVAMPILVAGIVAVALGSVIYSFLVWRAER